MTDELEEIDPNEWLHGQCGWSLDDLAEALGITRATSDEEIAALARQQVRDAARDGFLLDVAEIDRYLDEEVRDR